MAQSVARQAVNLQVAGSNPAGGGILRGWEAERYPSGYGGRLLSECALHAQVRTLPSALLPARAKVPPPGIEPGTFRSSV